MAHRLAGRLIAALILLMAGCAAASADVVATYETHVGRRVIEAAANGWGRIEEYPPGAAATPAIYTLTTPKGRNLRVMSHKGGWIVADWADYTAWLNRLWSPPGSTTPPSGRFVESGEEKIGAWTGTGYRMEGYCGAWRHFVVMRGPALETFGRVLRRNLLYAAKDRGPPDCERQAIDLMGEGVVLFVDDPEAKLAALEFRKIDPERFRLPSPVLSRAELFALLGADPAKSPVMTTPRAPGPPR
ncbi:MAG TPA: hypothetical protein VF574_09045 [Allosphingosinicella sp.]|jgi:hypothetical protein